MRGVGNTRVVCLDIPSVPLVFLRPRAAPSAATQLTNAMAATSFVQQAVARTFGVNKVSKVSASETVVKERTSEE